MSLRIQNLSRCPRWLGLVSTWLHKEWHGLTAVTLAERKVRLEQHLGDELAPSTWVAIADTKPVGSISLVQYSHCGDNGFWLANLFVLPRYRGQGYGAALCTFLEGVCIDHGIQRIKLFTVDKQHYYHRLRWQHLAQARVLGRDVSVMTKILPSVNVDVGPGHHAFAMSSAKLQS